MGRAEGGCVGDLGTAKGIQGCQPAVQHEGTGPLRPDKPAFLHSAVFENLADFEVSCHQQPEPWAARVVGSSTREQCSPSSLLLPACDVARPASACPGDQLRTVRDEVTGDVSLV